MITEIIIQHIRDNLRREHVAVLDEVLSTTIPGTEIDVFSFLFMVNTLFNDADPKMQDSMRSWSLPQWSDVVSAEVLKRSATSSTRKVSVTIPEATGAFAKKPLVPPPTHPPSQDGGFPILPGAPSSTTLPIPAPPVYLTDVEREAWVQARTRAGEFARGLGNYIEESTGKLVQEVWDKTYVKIEADPEERFKKVEEIRAKTADAVFRKKTADELARELKNEIEEWGRNWKRIAKTELQGAYNEATVIDAIRWDGPQAKLARPPENNACIHCKRLFLNENGAPKIFTAEELVNNGTNVGKKSVNWGATVWPIHPNCRCGTQAVPEGYVFDNNWSLVREVA